MSHNHIGDAERAKQITRVYEDCLPTDGDLVRNIPDKDGIIRFLVG